MNSMDRIKLRAKQNKRTIVLPESMDKIVLQAAEKVLEDSDSKGLLVCGSGIGISIAANRHPGIRAALVHCSLEAELSRKHNNANVIVMGGRIIGEELAKDALDKFLTTEFEGGRHENRIKKIEINK